MKIGITGATGQLGVIAVEKLKEKTDAANLVALVRTPAKAATLGVEARDFDYSKSETLADALQDIDTLLLISSSEVGQRAIQHKNVIKAAQQAGVKKIVYTSLLNADKSTLNLAKEHNETEKALQESGIDYAILRNGWYTENHTANLGTSIQAGGFIGSAGEGKFSSATREDFAEAAAAVVTSAGHEGKIYELGGDEAYTLSELAAEVSRQTGKTLPYNNLSEEEYSGVLKSFGLPDVVAGILSNSDTGASKGDLFDGSKTLSKLIGRPTTSLADAVKQAL